MFIAHFLTTWLGIPSGVGIALMFILRKQGKAFAARRKQERNAHQ